MGGQYYQPDLGWNPPRAPAGEEPWLRAWLQGELELLLAPLASKAASAPLRPIVKVHPETGRKSIYTGRHAHNIPGMTPEASQIFLDELLDWACQPPRTYRHIWSVGDLVVWDNRCLMHRACPYDESQPRHLRGSRISGEPASELAPTFEDSLAAAFNPSASNKSALAAGR